MAKTILVADDSATMLMSLKSALSLGGFKVETANNGQLAFDRLKAGFKPDLLLTYVNMQVMGGLEMIGKVRALPGCRFFPILTLTTESETASRSMLERYSHVGMEAKRKAVESLSKGTGMRGHDTNRDSKTAVVVAKPM